VIDVEHKGSQSHFFTIFKITCEKKWLNLIYKESRVLDAPELTCARKILGKVTIVYCVTSTEKSQFPTSVKKVWHETRSAKTRMCYTIFVLRSRKCLINNKILIHFQHYFQLLYKINLLLVLFPSRKFSEKVLAF
jgi:hypothetical protein